MELNSDTPEKLWKFLQYRHQLPKQNNDKMFLRDMGQFSLMQFMQSMHPPGAAKRENL